MAIDGISARNRTCDSWLAPLCNEERCCRSQEIVTIIVLVSFVVILIAVLIGVMWFYKAYRGARNEYKKRLAAKYERESIVQELGAAETKYLRRMSEMHNYPVANYDK